MNELKINGTQSFLGKEIPVIYGGFGEGRKVILAKTIAEIHGMKLHHVNENINKNIKRFKNGVDIIDLKQIGDADTFSELGFTKAQRGNAKNIYLLSERGYAKLIKIMDSDLAWDIHDQLMDEYFSMREQREQTPALTYKQQLAITLVADEEATMAERAKAFIDIQDICLAEGEAKGIELGTKYGEAIGKESICRDGLVTISRIREIVMEHYGEELAEANIVLSDPFIEFNRFLFHQGYFELIRFMAKDGKRKEKRSTYQPTPIFEEKLVEFGMASIRTIDERGKVEITYTEYIENFIKSEFFKTEFLKYVGVRVKPELQQAD